MFEPDLVFIRIRKLAAMLVDPFFRRAFRKHGVAPAMEHKAVLRRLPFDFVADVGANRGQFSLICRRLRPGAVIVGFEPLAGPATVYRAVFAGDPAVRLHQCALGQQRGEAVMNIAGRDDSSSLLPISDVQTKYYPGTELVATQTVAIGPLSDFVQPAEVEGRSLLKMDVQGFELEVLKSSEALLPRFRWIYAECSFVPLYEGQALADEIIAWLAARNFRLKGRFNPSYGRDRTLLQQDLLFENDGCGQAALLATNQL